MTNKIKFIGYDSPTPVEEHVVPAVKSHPDWYTTMEKTTTTEKWGKMPTVKSCTPFFDAMSAGYVYITPCDIEFYMENGRPRAKVLDDRFPEFIGEREAFHATQFTQVKNHHGPHFHWYPLWAPKVPDGYSVLYTQPLNRYELPFLTTNGIIDNDQFAVPGNMPFFLNRGFVGVLPKGTPFAQLIPIKRESWKHESENLDPEARKQIYAESSDKYRQGIGVYRKGDWEVKHYK